MKVFSGPIVPDPTCDQCVDSDASARCALSRICRGPGMTRAKGREDGREEVASSEPLAYLFDLSSRLVLSPSFSPEGLADLFASLGQQIGCELVFNVLLDDADEALREGGSGELDAAARNLRTSRVGDLLCSAVAQTRRALIVEDLQSSDDPNVSLLKASGVRAYAGFPLLSGTRLLGITEFAPCQRDRFGADALDLIRTSCDLIAAAFARHQLTRDLVASEARYRAVFENAGVGIGQVRLSDHRSTAVNDAMCRMLGYTRDELLALHWTDITHPDDSAFDMAFVDRLEAGDIDRFALEKRYIHKDGHVVWGHLTISLVRDAFGRPEFEIGVIKNITARKRAEAALTEAMKDALSMARTDSLTGLPNRTAFHEALASINPGTSRGVLFFDVNGFKRGNDSLGHVVADDIIRSLAERLKGLMQMDCFLAWIGGDGSVEQFGLRAISP